MYKKYLLSVFVLFTAFTVIVPNTASAFWPFDWLKKSEVQSENLTGAVAKADSGVSICQFTELLIGVGIIPQDKIVLTRQIASQYCSSSLSSQSLITVISPNGGEVWKAGEVREIKWETKNIPLDSKINLEIFKEGTDEKLATAIYHGLSATTTSYKWSVLMATGNYRIFAKVISTNGTYVAVDTSDMPFSVISHTSSSSSISVKPYISDINPKSGAVGSKITLWGRGFIETSRISFGGGMIQGALFYQCGDSGEECADFKIPNTINMDCYYQTPKCLTSSIVIKPGIYPVSVYNSNGISNKVYFQVVSSSSSSSISSKSSSSKSSLSSSSSSSSGSDLSLMLTDLSSKSVLIDNGSRAPATSTVEFQFTMNNVGVSPLYVSKTPSILVATSTTTGSLGRLTLLSASTDPIMLHDDTGAYYVIPKGSSRKFTLDGFFGKYSTSGAVEFKITKIYFGDEKKGLQKFNIDSGLEKLRAVAIF